MSNYYKRRMSLAGIDLASLTSDDLRGLVRKILESKIHGLSFSPYVEGQGKGEGPQDHGRCVARRRPGAQ